MNAKARRAELSRMSKYGIKKLIVSQLVKAASRAARMKKKAKVSQASSNRTDSIENGWRLSQKPVKQKAVGKGRSYKLACTCLLYTSPSPRD